MTRDVNERSVELGHLAWPEGTDDAPGVVMIHDVWGLADHTRDLARRLAGEGFRVLAVDLYRREATVEITDPGAWMRELSDPQVLADLGEAAAFLSSGPGANPVGVVGFCMGGTYALMAACTDTGGPAFAASVPFYGLLSHGHGLLAPPEGALDAARKPHEPLALAARLHCPLLAFFGDSDTFIPLEDVAALEAALAGAESPSEVVVVPGAGHAFMNDTRPEAHRPEAAAKAWGRTVAFLHEHLG